MLRRYLMTAAALVLICCLLLPSPALCATSEEIRQEINRLEEEEEEIRDRIKKLQDSITQNREELKGLLAEKQNLDQQIALISAQLSNLETQIRSVKLLIADREDEYAQALLEYEQLNIRYKERIRAMEERPSPSYWSVLFRSSSFSDFLDRMELIREITQADKRRIAQLTEAADAVERSKNELTAQKQELDDVLLQQQIVMEALNGKKEEIQLLVREMAAKGKEYEEMLEQSEDEQHDLMDRIAQMEDEFDKAAYEEWLAAHPPEPPKPEINENVVNGITWITPVPWYILTSPFGMRIHPITGEYKMHNGIDMGCNEGTEIYATRSGLVEIAQWSNSAGNYVQLNHGDGYRSVYMHMTHYIVSAGQYVQAGQVIGYVGNTGASRGNHLHFGVSYNGTYINPYPLISK